MEDEVQPGPGWQWITVGVELYDGHDPEDPGGDLVVVPDRLRVKRHDDEGRQILRVDVRVMPKRSGGWYHGVTGVEFFGDDEHLIGTATLRSLGLDADIDDFVRSQMRTRVAAPRRGSGFAAELAAWDNATYEPVDFGNEGVRFATSQARSAVSARERAASIDSEVEEAARLYREDLAAHAAEKRPGKAKPVEFVRARTGWSQRTAARRIEQARQRGLLPATTKGRAKA